jgi:hypothetical protein
MSKPYYYIKLRFRWLDDPTIGRLASDALKWRYLQCYLQAGDYERGGDLPSVPDMAYRFRVPVDALRADLAALQAAGLLALDGDTWRVVGFANEQAPYTDKERQQTKRSRESKPDDTTQDDTKSDETTRKDTEGNERVEEVIIIDGVTPQSRGVTSTSRGVTNDDDHHDDDAPPPSVLQAWRDARPTDAPALSRLDKRRLSDLVKQHSEEWVMEAIKDGTLSCTRGMNLNYLAAILDNWKERGFKADKPSELERMISGWVKDSERREARAPKVLEGGAVMMPTATRRKEYER